MLQEKLAEKGVAEFSPWDADTWRKRFSELGETLPDDVKDWFKVTRVKARCQTRLNSSSACMGLLLFLLILFLSVPLNGHSNARSRSSCAHHEVAIQCRTTQSLRTGPRPPATGGRS